LPEYALSNIQQTAARIVSPGGMRRCRVWVCEDVVALVELAREAVGRAELATFEDFGVRARNP